MYIHTHIHIKIYPANLFLRDSAWTGTDALSLTCANVAGVKYERLRTRMAAIHPLLDRFVVEHAYGRVLARDGVRKKKIEKNTQISK